MAYQILKQSDDYNAPPTALEAKNDGFDTGLMTECVSAVVMWGRDDKTRKFTSVVGKHGGGGIQNVDFAALLAGRSGETLVVVVGGSSYRPEYNQGEYDRLLERWGAQKSMHASGNVHFAGLSVFGRATIDRFGNALAFEEEKVVVKHWFLCCC